eukprot:TRINITY_DN8013_c0_g1_i1.p1 TRINITY_DN8013_c0_g1~~TRINITY_DN8013_c0_g1_i1.p1  ORF type:complete len:213 (-),score=34.71 TRINITY_DN8013_c0_g1_i1:51-689(-)
MVDETVQALIAKSLKRANERVVQESANTSFLMYMTVANPHAAFSPRVQDRPKMFVDDNSFQRFLQHQNTKIEDAIVFFKSSRNKLAILLEESTEQKLFLQRDNLEKRRSIAMKNAQIEQIKMDLAKMSSRNPTVKNLASRTANNSICSNSDTPRRMQGNYSVSSLLDISHLSEHDGRLTSRVAEDPRPEMHKSKGNLLSGITSKFLGFWGKK